MTDIIMPLGDSMTAGARAGVDESLWGGYRTHLEELLQSAGYDFDYVGGETSGPIALADQHHEGHPFFRIDDLNANAPTWLAANPPQTILLMAGANDLLQLQSGGIEPPATWGSILAGRMATLLATIFTFDPTIRVIMSVNPIMLTGNLENGRLDYKALLPGVVAGRVTAGQDVTQVDASSVDTLDAIGHPSDLGDQQLAALWFGVLVESPISPAMPRMSTYRLTNIWSTGTDADTSAYDDCTDRYMRPPGLRIDGIGRAEERAFAPPGTPALDFTLTNHDGLYSPGGTLGSFVGRGPRSTVEAIWGTDIFVDAGDVMVDDDGIMVDGYLTKPLFRGAITTAPQRIDRPAAVVQVRALGTIARLQRSRPITTLYENIRTDEAITVILDAVSWEPDRRVIDTGDQELLYWWLDGSTDAMTAIRTLLATEGAPACAYEDGQGIFHFEGRQYRTLAERSVNEQWHLFDGPAGTNPITDDALVFVDDANVTVDGPIGGLYFHVQPSAWAANPDSVVGTVTGTVNVRTPTAVMKIWEYGGPLVLTPGQTVDIPVTSSDPFKGAVTPLAGTDYTVSSGLLGGVSLLATSGQRIVLRMTDGGFGSTVIGVTSSGIQVRAVSLPVTTVNPLTSTVDVALSAARYEPKDYELQLWPEIDWNEGLDRVNSFARRYQLPRDQMTVQIVNLDAEHMYAILTMAVSDRVKIAHRHGRINAPFHIEAMHHDLSSGGGLHRLTLSCERVTDDIPARFGAAEFGTATFSE